MKFWDASAVIPLCIDECHSVSTQEIIREDGYIVAWWGSSIECFSAFARLRREGLLNDEEEDQMNHLLSVLSESWIEIMPGEEVRTQSKRLLRLHPLRAADSLQLAAAIMWAGMSPKGQHFVCFDRKLRNAARKEGFQLMPAEI
ncbi:MAG: type II toxin-antitoxin system VapC family toxin [Methylococcaceae bacterium]